MPPLIRLRALLLSNWFYGLLICLTSFYLIINYYHYYRLPQSIQNISVTGIVIKIKQQGDNYQLIIKNKHHYLITLKELRSIKLGFIVKVIGPAVKPSINTIPGGFNYQKYCLANNIHYLLNPTQIKIINSQQSLIYIIKEHVQQYFLSINHPYINAFILGDTTFIKPSIMNSYRNNGISHLFAISGLHISLLVIIFKIILNKFSQYQTLIICLLLLFFNFITGWLPSIMRATIIFIYSVINRRMAFQCNKTRLFIFTAITNLLLFPFQIFHLGFWYSYVISFYLIISFKRLTGNYFLKSLKVSLLAALSSFPISFYYFYQFNLLSIIYNLFFIPLVSFIIYPGILISGIIPLCLKIINPFIQLMEQTSLILTKFNWGTINTPKPLLIIIIAYYGLLYLLIIKPSKKYLIIIVLLIFGYYFSTINYHFELYVLDVGQGDAIFIRTEFNRQTILIDTGGNNFFNQSPKYYDGKNIVNFLKSIGVNQLNYLIITHGDADHINDASYIVKQIKTKQVIFNCGNFNKLEQDLVKVLDKKNIPYYSCIKELNIEDNKLYFLNNKNYGNENNNSSVVYSELNYHKILLMGDAGVEVEEDLIEKYNLKDIDVLKIGHHGSKTSSSKNFIDEVNPKYSIISVGKNNRYGHPNDSVLENLAESKIYRTDQDRSIMFKINKNKLEIKNCSP